MAMDLKTYQPLIRDAVAMYWTTLKNQSEKQARGTDHGNRSAVTGGKQMLGFCRLVQAVLTNCGLSNAEIYLEKKLELPGYYRATKNWDLVIVKNNQLVGALEFKSQRGPSFGNNFNNRSEEAIGTATDLWVAHREGAFGKKTLTPWLGWVMLLEDCPASTKPVSSKEPHFPVFPEFKKASYADRYEILLRKLVRERLYSSSAFIMATDKGGPKGDYIEPAKDLSMNGLLASLAGHVGVYLATR